MEMASIVVVILLASLSSGGVRLDMISVSVVMANVVWGIP